MQKCTAFCLLRLQFSFFIRPSWGVRGCAPSPGRIFYYVKLNISRVVAMIFMRLFAKTLMLLSALFTFVCSSGV